MRTRFFCMMIAALSLSVVSAAPPEPDPNVEALRWDADTKDCALKAGETTAAFTFVVTNVSKVDVVINRLHATCGCTAAKLPAMPYRLGAGSNVAIHVEMQLAGKYGLIRKSVTVDSSVGLKTLTVSANIPLERRGEHPARDITH